MRVPPAAGTVSRRPSPPPAAGVIASRGSAVASTRSAKHVPGFRVVDLREIFGATADAVAAIDHDQRIVGWNQAATELLGYRAEEVLGRRCDEVLGWHDRCGDVVCRSRCPSPARAERDEIIESREVLGRSSRGKRLWLNVTTVVPPPAVADVVALIHLMREVSLPPELERLVAERLSDSGHNGHHQECTCEGAEALGRLTAREREVLDLLADGRETAEIARQLVISPATVRNHVQKILTKLEVHSRLEAVALLLRHHD